MELREGSLDYQVALGPLSFDLVREIVRQVLTALENLHNNNKLHTAIKPGNFFIDATGIVQLSDVAASLGGDLSASSAKYLAPELLKPEFGEVGRRLDLYCLGFTALELLKGPAFDALFPGVGPHDIDVEIAWMRWHSSSAEALPSAGVLIPGLPADLVVVLDRLLKKTVKQRYPSATAALQDLAPPPLSTAGPGPRNTTETRSVPVTAIGSKAPTGSVLRMKRQAGKKIVLSSVAVLLLSAASAFFIWNNASDKIAVTIASVPPQAKVFIDQKPVAKATDANLELPPGEYVVRLELDDYEPFEGKIGISEQRRAHKITLNKLAAKQDIKPDPIVKKKEDPVKKIVKPVTNTVHVASDPPGAAVYINDKLQDQKTNGDFEVDSGPLTLKLVHKGLPPLVREFDEPGKLAKAMPIVFDRLVTLRSEPPGASFFLDGKPHKDKTVLTMKPGKYQVKAVLDGYAPEEKILDVGPSGLTHEYSLTLRSLPVQRHALLIGVLRGSEALPSFVHAESDAESLGRALQVGGFKGDQVTILTQTRGQVQPSELPTAANIKARLHDLANSSVTDTHVVALIGHCIELPGQDGTYFCPAEADLADPKTLVGLEEVLQALQAIPSKKKLLFLDCWRKDWKSTDKHVRSWDKPAPPGVTILFSCGPGQTGYEHPSSRHSLFAHFLVQGLLGEAAEGQVSGPALGEYCKRQVAALVSTAYRDAEQVPQLALGAGSEPWAITAPGESTAEYLKGCALLAKKNYGGAVEAFNRAEKVLPNFVELYLQRAEAYYHKKLFEPAMADCRTALTLDSNNATAYSNLAESESESQLKDFASAIKNFTKAIDLDPEYASAYNSRGKAYIASADYETAIKDLTEAIRLQPQLVFPWGNRGIAQSRRKHWDEAIADFDKAIALDGKQANLFGERGNAWSQKKNPERALEDYTTAINLDGTNGKWWLSRGTLRFKSNDLDNAITDLRKATDLQPEYKVTWLNLGVAYNEKKMYGPAANALERAVQIDPTYSYARRLLISAYRELGNDKKVKEHKNILDKEKK